MNKITKILLVTVLVVFLVTGCGCGKKEVVEKKTANTNEGVIEDKKVEDLELTNTSLISTENSATLVTKVFNPTAKDKEVRIFDIIVKDKDGAIITTLQGYVGGIVPAGQFREITSNVDMNLSKAYTVEYKIVN